MSSLAKPTVSLCRLLSALAALLPALALAQPGEEPPKFDIWEFQVGGVGKLNVDVIEKAVYPFLGPARTLDDVQKAAESLEKAYRDAGYATVVVSIPEQSVSGGVVELAVTEGRIERVRVTGARYYSQERILERLPALAEGEVPDFNALQAQLAALSATPDRSVQPLLRPGHQPGTTEVELKVADNSPLHGSVELSNRYSPSRARNPGYQRLSGTVRHDNLWQREHSLSLSYLTSPGHAAETRVGSFAYALPGGEAGETLSFYGMRSDSKSDLTTSLAGTNVLGRGDILGARLNRPIASVAGVNHGLSLGLDYKHLKEDLVMEGSGSFPTPLTYWLGSARYDGGLAHLDGQTGFGLGALLSLRGLRNNEDQFANKRYLGQGNFAILQWNLQRVQNLPAKFDLVARAEGQLSSLPLPSSEQFAIGGASSVRGYPEATQIGDRGTRVMLELRTPNLVRGEEPWGDLRLLAFREAAWVSVHDPLPGQTGAYTLASQGLGLRLATRSGLILSLDHGRRLRDGMTTDTHGSVARGGSKLHFNLGFRL